MNGIRQTKVLVGLLLICLLGWGSYVRILFDEQEELLTGWNKEAEDAFEEALWSEMDRRAKIPFYSYNQNGRIILEKRKPDSVAVNTRDEVLHYEVDKHKFDWSLMKEEQKRSFWGDMFFSFPLSVDTLIRLWEDFLQDKNIPAKGGIRYIYTDLNLQNDTACSKGFQKQDMDSLTARYLGLRCEHEWVSYVSYPSWYSRLSLVKWCFLLIPWFVCGVLVVLLKKNSIQKQPLTIDQLKACSLSPQLTVLLKLFLSKENHSLSLEEIDQGLWNGKGTKDRIHKVVQRLRTELKKFSSDITIEYVGGAYELKLPISSNNNEKE